MAIISMGVVYVTSKASVSQRDMQVQEIAISQLRNLLHNGVDLCAAGQTVTLPGTGAAAIQTQGCAANQPVDLVAVIGASSIAVPSPVVMSVNIGANNCQNCSVVVGGSAQ